MATWQQYLSAIDPSQIVKHDPTTYLTVGDNGGETATNPGFYTLSGVNFGMGETPWANAYGAWGNADIGAGEGLTTYGNNNISYAFDKDGNVVGARVKVSDKEAYDVPYVNGQPQFDKAQQAVWDTNTKSFSEFMTKGVPFVLGGAFGLNALTNAGLLGAGGTGSASLSAAPTDLSHIYGSIANPGYSLPATGVAPPVSGPLGETPDGPSNFVDSRQAIIDAEGGYSTLDSYGNTGQVPFADKVKNIGLLNATTDTIGNAISGVDAGGNPTGLLNPGTTAANLAKGVGGTSLLGNLPDWARLALIGSGAIGSFLDAKNQPKSTGYQPAVDAIKKLRDTPHTERNFQMTNLPGSPWGRF